MATYTRTSAWNNGGTFNNPVLLWYAKGVGVLQSRKLNDTSSWWFFAAIHGHEFRSGRPTYWGSLPSPPTVPITPVPSDSDIKLYWDQCQHQSWYFLPWHRGYLLALEAQVRKAIEPLGGPSDWALPYWNYFGPGNQYQIPPAFAEKTLPDGSPNPLYVEARYGPDFDHNAYIPTPVGIKQHPGDPNFVNGPVLEDCLSDKNFIGDSGTPPKGFGGPQTRFSHGGGSFGDLELNPHGLVHVYVGSGSKPPKPRQGLMSDPDTAGLDPIFYLHHANIDRMWAVWNITEKNANPPDKAWLNGPVAPGRFQFVMPLPGGKSWIYTPSQMSDLNQQDYTYDDLSGPPKPVNALAQRLMRLGVAKEEAASAAEKETPMITGEKIELAGASPTAIKLETRGARTRVQLDSMVRNKVSASLRDAAETKKPDHVFLELENVRGNRDAYVLSVYVNLPPEASPGEHPELLAGSAPLFGLRTASEPDGEHAGQGLNFVMDISKIVDDLHLQNALDTNSLNISIVPQRPIQDEADITVGRVNIYRKGD
jgi:tyrosinase